jgi:UDP-N-acetylglucosamine 2-epimerase
MNADGCTLFISDEERDFHSHALSIAFSAYQRAANRLWVLPCLRKLSLENRLVVLALNEDLRGLLERTGIPYKRFEDYGDLEVVKHHSTLAEALAGTWYQVERGGVREDVTIYDGFSLGNLFEAEFYCGLLPLFVNIERLGAVIDAERPSQVCVQDVSYLNRIGLQLARSWGIPTARLLPTFLGYPRRLAIGLRAARERHQFEATMHSSRRTLERRSFAETPGLRKILVVNTTPGAQVSTLVPVIRELEKDPTNKVLVIAEGLNVQQAFRAKDIPVQSLQDRMTPEVASRVAEGRRELQAKWSTLRADPVFRAFFTYRGRPLWGAVEQAFRKVFVRDFVERVREIEIFRSLMQQEGVDLVVVAIETFPAMKTAVAVANRLGVPSLTIQHGVVTFQQGLDYLGNLPVAASKIAVFGEASQAEFIRAGTPAEKVVVTGRPTLDMLYEEQEAFDPDELRRRLGLKDGQRLIVLATQDDCPEVNEPLLRSVYGATKNLPDTRLVVKVHPRESPRLAERIAVELKMQEVIIIKDIDPYQLLLVCEVLITRESTIALEAMMLDKPVITINLTGKPDLRPYAKSGAAVGVYDSKDVAIAILDVLQNSEIREKLRRKSREFVAHHAYRADGQASRRVADLIEGMIGESRRMKEQKARV